MKNKKTVKERLAGLLAGIMVVLCILSPATLTGHANAVDDFSSAYESVESHTTRENVAPSGDYMVNVEQGEQYNLTFNHEDQSYNAGETVTFSGDLPKDRYLSVVALQEESIQRQNTNDLLYAEIRYDSKNDEFHFEMPHEDVSLYVITEMATTQTPPVSLEEDSTDSWNDATEVEADSYYYYSDGKIHKFDTVMGKGGNDSYKYVRYKVGDKTYTVQSYCMQHSKPSPASGTTYKNMVELNETGDDAYLRKAFFYGYGGPGWGDTFNGYNIKEIMVKAGCKNEMRVMQHYLVDYLYDGESGFGGNLSTRAKNMLRDIKEALSQMPDPTSGKLEPSLSTATKTNETEIFTWNANEEFTLTIHLENGVSLVNKTTGVTGTGDVTVKGHDQFYLKATTADTSSLKGEYNITSNYPLDFHAMLLKLSKSQDIGFGYFTDSTNLSLHVTWADKAGIELTKKGAKTNQTLSGAVYGLYSDIECKNLIAKMPATDANGTSSISITKTQDCVYLKEITAPKGYKIDTKVHNVNLMVGESAKIELTDEEEDAKLKIIKRDGETGKTILTAGAEFKVYDVTNQRYVEQNGKTSYVTNEQGYLVLPETLSMGKYRIEEVNAPNGYLLNNEYIEVTVNAENMNRNDNTVEVRYTDDAVKGKIMLHKKGEFLEDYKQKQFIYKERFLKDAVFEVIAAENIYTPDYQKDTNGNRVIKYVKDTVVETVTTNEEGEATVDNLPLGKYIVKEKTAPEGFVLDTTPQEVELSYDNQLTPVVTKNLTFRNERQKVKLTLEKQDEETSDVLPEATFGLYNKNNIMKGKQILVSENTLLEEVTTAADGKALFHSDLPLGEYYIKEIKAPAGYILSPEVLEITAKADKQEQKEITLNTIIKNKPTFVEITKSDLTTGEELENAHLKVTNEEGDTVDEWVSVKEPHRIKGLEVGKKYTLTETKPADGYATAENIEFTIENDKDIQKVEMKDDVTKIEISKTDITGSEEIPGAKLTIFDENHQEIESWISTDKPHYIEKLPVGKYTLREEQAPKGYIINSEETTFEVADTTEIQKVSMKNERAKGKVIINKTDKDSKKPLSGVEFELRDSEGKVVETLKTDKTGHAESQLVDIATFENGEYKEALKYTLVETKALDGYELDRTEKEIIFEYVDENTPVSELTFHLENKKKEKPEKPEKPKTPKSTTKHTKTSSGSYESSKTVGNPKTGDDNHFIIPVIVMIAAISYITIMMKKKKR